MVGGWGGRGIPGNSSTLKKLGAKRPDGENWDGIHRGSRKDTEKKKTLAALDRQTLPDIRRNAHDLKCSSRVHWKLSLSKKQKSPRFKKK